MDAANRALLHAYMARTTWRRAIRELAVSERTIRAALDSRRIRVASARAIRLAIALNMQPTEPQS